MNIDQVVEHGSTTYQVYTLILTEQQGEDGKWYSMPKYNSMLRDSRSVHPTVDAALRDKGAVDQDAVAAFVKRVLLSAIEEAGGVPLLKISITTNLLKGPPKNAKSEVGVKGTF